jgi:subtilisin-like proprotein convertase family protein
MKHPSNHRTVVFGLVLLLAGEGVSALAQLAAVHQTAAGYTPGSTIGVTNSFPYTNTLWSLLWRPHLPSGWTVLSVSGTGSPELQAGDIVWTGSMPASPIQMVYVVQVPAGASGAFQVRGEVEYQLAGMVNPATLYATPDPLALSGGAALWSLTVGSSNPDTGVAIGVSPPDNNGTSNGVTGFSRQYTNQAVVALLAPAVAGGNAFQRWEQDGAVATTNLAAAVLMGTNHVLRAVYGGTALAQHACGGTYSAGGQFGVTNTFTYTGQLWSLLWRPRLPANWAIGSVTGSGAPELQAGDIVWTGTMPASPIQMVYVVQVPAGPTGLFPVRGEVEYQLAGMVNPATVYATPDPLSVSNLPPATRTLTVASLNPSAGVAVAVSPADNNGNSNGVTKFSRQYPNGTAVTLTATATASGNAFQRWEQDAVPVTTNRTAAVVMDANHVVTAIYAPVPPSIREQPQSQTVAAGANVLFSVAAAGSPPLAYQWRRNGANLTDGSRVTGARTNSLTILSVQTGEAGSYTVLVTNAAGAATSQVATLTVVPAIAPANTNRIYISDYRAATPYPSSITVAGQAGTVERATVALLGLSHSWPDDIGVLLTGPQGQKIVLMNDAGGSQPIGGVNLAFDDNALDVLPDEGTIVSGSYRPSPGEGLRAFAAPAPAGPYAAALANLQGADPNGTWSLYVQDFAAGDSGAIAGGWTLTLILEPPPPCPYFVPGTLCCLPNGQFECQFAGTAGSNYEIQASSDLTHWKTLKTMCLSSNSCRFVDGNTNVVRRFYRAKLLP